MQGRDVTVTQIRVKAATALHGKDRFAQFAVMLPIPKRMKLQVVDIPFQFPLLNRFRQDQFEAVRGHWQ